MILRLSLFFAEQEWKGKHRRRAILAIVVMFLVCQFWGIFCYFLLIMVQMLSQVCMVYSLGKNYVLSASVF